MRSSIRKSLVIGSLAFIAGVDGTQAHADGYAHADAGDALRWQSIAGIVLAGNVVGTGAGPVTGGGAAWAALDGRASVKL